MGFVVQLLNYVANHNRNYCSTWVSVLQVKNVGGGFCLRGPLEFHPTIHIESSDGFSRPQRRGYCLRCYIFA